MMYTYIILVRNVALVILRVCTSTYVEMAENEMTGSKMHEREIMSLRRVDAFRAWSAPEVLRGRGIFLWMRVSHLLFFVISIPIASPIQSKGEEKESP